MLYYVVEDHLVSCLLLLSFVLTLVFLGSVGAIGSRWARIEACKKLPPGPRRIPVWGNLMQFFRERDAGRLVPYLASLNQYGSMATLQMGSKTWVMLNDDKVISDIIDKHGKVTSERPAMLIAGGLVSHNLRTVIRRTAPWIEGRRVMHHLFSGSVLRRYGNWQELESSLLLSNFLDAPQRWHSHIYRYSTAVYYRMVMGERLRKTQSELDEFQQIAMEFIWSVFWSSIDFFPQLDRLPHFLQPWRSFWATMGHRHNEVSHSWWEPVQQAVHNGTAKSSFVRDTLLHPDVKYKGDEEEAMYLATSVIATGADITRMTLNVIMMAACCYPKIFAHVRDFLDRECGQCSDLRLPRLDDMGSLPYMLAFVKEILRWRPTVPLSPPHELTDDLVYEGYHFPKGTNFVINVIAASQNMDRCDEFDPQRWLDGNEMNVITGLWVFGGGRRICVGYKVAQQALFVAMARLDFCFDITPREALDSQKLNHLTINEPFPVNVKIRGPAYERLIRKDTELVNAHDS